MWIINTIYEAHDTSAAISKIPVELDVVLRIHVSNNSAYVIIGSTSHVKLEHKFIRIEYIAEMNDGSNSSV